MNDLIAAHLAYLRAQGCSPAYIAGRSQVLQRLDRQLPRGLNAATTDELNNWQADQPGWSTIGTRHTMASHIRCYFAWACRGNDPHLDWNPADDMGRPKAPRWVARAVTDQQLVQALTRAPEPWYTAILLAAYAGLRVSELMGLCREHLTEQTIFVAKAKGGQPATVPTHPLVWRHLADRPSGPVLRNTQGRPLRRKFLSDCQRAFFDSIGLQGVTMHRFRHWYGSTLLDHTGNVRVVQECLRHAHMSSVQIYTRVADRQRSEAIRSLPVLASPLQDAA